MHNIYNSSETFYLYDILDEKMSLIGNENEFINLLAKAYVCYGGSDIFNTYLDNFACSPGDVTVNTRWQFFDGVDRCINPKLYEKQAYSLWIKKYKNLQDKNGYRYWKKNKTYKGIFRKTPVSGITSLRGGPRNRKPRHSHHIYEIYSNPEYKDFNRGFCWEIHPRCVERNWKSQRKYQWKERKDM